MTSFATNGNLQVNPYTSNGTVQETYVALHVTGDIGSSNGQGATITVPANNTLFVTWHLVWTGIGQNATSILTGCANANAPISATGGVIGTNISETCTADALGYRKK